MKPDRECLDLREQLIKSSLKYNDLNKLIY